MAMPESGLLRDLLEVLPLCLAAAAGGLVVTSMFVLAPFIVLALGATENRQAVGFWSGAIVSAFYTGRLVTAPFWGWVADRYGRRVVLTGSLATTGAASLACGLAVSVRSVTAIRFLTGCFSAVQATCHAMAWELRRTRGTAMVESAWTIASMLGPGLSVMCWDLQLAGRSATGLPPHFAACALLAILQLFPVPFLPKETLRQQEDSQEQPNASLQGRAARYATFQGPDARKTGGDLVQILALNAAFVFVGSAMDEVSILFGVGRLGFSEKGMGSVFLLAGAMDLLLQNTLLFKMVESFPPMSVRRWALVGYIPPLAIMPMALSEEMPLNSRVWGMALTILLRKLSSYLFAVSNTVLLNEAGKEGLAATHAKRLMTASVMQMAGPFLGSTAYAWLATAAQHPHLSEDLVFVAAALCVALMISSMAWAEMATTPSAVP